MSTKLYRYQPEDNRTPVTHPVIGHLEYGEVYDNPACAKNPDFVEIKHAAPKKTTAKKGTKTSRKTPEPAVHTDEPKQAPNPDPVSAAEPGTTENPIVDPSTLAGSGDTEPPAEPADADHPFGRSE